MGYGYTPLIFTFHAHWKSSPRRLLFTRETLTMSSTQGATFIHVRFSNVKLYMEKWFKIGIAPSTRQVLKDILEDRRRHLQLQLLERFISLCIKEMIEESFNGFIIDGSNFTPRAGMFMADQPIERTVLCYKRRDLDMDCTHCILQSSIRNVQPRS